MSELIPLIIITGPTASGKSGLSIELAKRFNGEIISADSMQVYRQMDIGTAKITVEEAEGVKHHLLNIIEPWEEFSVAEYVTLARNTINEIYKRGKTPFLVGGTSLYISSIVDNIQFFDLASDIKLREELKAFASENGNQKLWDKLNKIDPKLAKTLHPNNQGRVIRGIEVFFISGKPLSYWQELSRSEPSPYNSILIGLAYRDRNMLYERINQRVDEMIDQGLVGEVQNLYELKCSKTAKQAIGYKELWGYINGDESLEQGVDRLKMETRRYAKRQMTWMRGRNDLIWLNKDDYPSREHLVCEAEKAITNKL